MPYGSNDYCVTHFIRFERTEEQRITETLANAMEVARDALDAVHDISRIPECKDFGLERYMDDLFSQVEAGALLSSDFRKTAHLALFSLKHSSLEAADPELVKRALNRLEQTLGISERIIDLLKSRKEIKAYQNNRG